MKAIMLKTHYKSFHGMIKSSNNMVPVFFDIVSSSDKWINLAQPDGDNKTFKKTCYSNHFFRTHTISNILEFFYITRTNL